MLVPFFFDSNTPACALWPMNSFTFATGTDDREGVLEGKESWKGRIILRGENELEHATKVVQGEVESDHVAD